jgi:SAM-dependent methyltransferase
MRPDLLRRWLTTDPEAYDRMVDQDHMGAYLATIDTPLLATCRGRVLELACGTGRLLRRLGARAEVQHVVGLDIAPRMLAAAAAQGHRMLVQASAEALPFSSGQFDSVCCAFYTLRDLERSTVYAEVARVLRPGGVLAFTLRSYYTAYLETLWRHFLRHGHRPRSWRNLDGADDVERDLRSVKAEVAALERAGLRLREVSGVRFIPFLRRRVQPGYWHGALAIFGSDVIFIVEKPGG